MNEKSKKLGTSCIYEIDADDRIVFCNDEWNIFAIENNGPEMLFEKIKGKVLWDFISDSSTGDLYKRLVTHVRTGSVVKFSLRCDSPSLFRLLEMKITFTGKKRVRFLTRVKTIADRGSHSFHFVDHKPSKEPLLVCSWCSRVNIHRQIWQTVEIAVTKLKIFEQAKMPLVSHGICNDCLKNINRLLDKAE